MNIYKEYILPLGINWLLSRPECLALRRCVADKLKGVVLEIGFGTGLNLPYYPKTIKRIYAVDPSRFGRRLASERIKSLSVPVEFIGLDGEDLPLDSNTVDAVLSTWTLCTIPDVLTSLNEIRRVLKPGGKFHFLEHGLSPDENVTKWQNRFNPIQKVIGCGCQLNRKIDSLIIEAGFHMDSIENFYMKGPKLGSYMYKGIARNVA